MAGSHRGLAARKSGQPDPSPVLRRSSRGGCRYTLQQVLQTDFELLDRGAALDGNGHNGAGGLDERGFFLAPGSNRRAVIDLDDAVADLYSRFVARTIGEYGYHLEALSAVIEAIENATSCKHIRLCMFRFFFEVEHVTRPVDGDGKSFENVFANCSSVPIPRGLAITEISDDAMHTIRFDADGLDARDPAGGRVASRATSEDAVILMMHMIEDGSLPDEPLADADAAEISRVDNKISLNAAADAGLDDHLGRVLFE